MSAKTKFKITNSELRAISSISGNFSVVFLVSMVFPVFSRGFDINDWAVLLFGLGLTVGLIALAIYCARKGKL